MVINDSIADLLTRIRNAQNVYHDKVDAPASKIKLSIVEALKREGFIKSFKLIEDNKQGMIRIYLRYGPSKEKYFAKLVRVSKPGRRVYLGKDKIPNVLNGLGIAVLSTSKGILTNKECQQLGIGGEMLCYVY
ncbi:30S ribosomal protein S8 [bacterium]|nr:30S ribosomal protein S8 [bacterium]MBU0899843.1 30S ribosomal protein S8 [bacterium]MBU1153617.1 30S ribosomal protein S8 [bacterium]MBU2600254.1 30S ribosomal protein S8 [bacterium]